MTSELKSCERCGANADRLYLIGQENEFDPDEDGKIVYLNVCWSCDHDVCNGGDLFEDAANIFADRQAEAYAYDPINTERPF